MPMLFHVVPNPELHNGQAIQMIDEVRQLDDPAEPEAPVHEQLH